MADIFRDSICGQIVRVLFRGRLLYVDERPNFEVPDFEQKSIEKIGKNNPSTNDEEQGNVSSGIKEPSRLGIVGWYGSDDQDNPQNWSTPKKVFISALITLLTFSGRAHC